MNQATDYFAMIPSATDTIYCQNTVLIYSILSQKFEVEIISETTIKSVRLTSNRLIVVTEDKIDIFKFRTGIRHLASYKTYPNPMGLCEITPLIIPGKNFIVYPGITIGSIYFMEITAELEIYFRGLSTTGKIDAHDEEISCLAINPTGALIASSSSKGTSIRIWNIHLKVMVAELSLGPNTATLSCMNFSPNSEFVCCSNAKGKIQVFKLIKSNLNRQSSSSQTALASFTLTSETGCICTFSNRDTVVAISLDGIYRILKLSNDGISCIQEQRLTFLRRPRN
ncbi:PREDICTED: WD repeat domain phosphoinositide-interacting protein 4-like [Diuraphis noxia]|uniref:WD repeat domain phosphoinositide-interacting protein 4-like n=1 Tax=Diuraphis noxia TaxID=143948 RepID=UPI00076390FE|nr:PREDICTED: WD repeat domain phosphoinositide-interacting protein 4-like [Diuraphis noxia]